MNNISYQTIVDDNIMYKCWGELAFLKTHQLLGVDISEESIAIGNEMRLIEPERTDESKTWAAKTDAAQELVYHKLWNKLKPFHQANRIEHFVSGLKNITKKNAQDVLSRIKKAQDAKLFMATNSTYKETTSKKNKYVIDYDPVKGLLVSIEGINYNGETKLYETEF